MFTNYRFAVLSAAAMAALLCAVIVLVTDSPLRVLAGLLLAFVLPGPGLLWSLFPSRSISGVEEFVVAAGLSLAAIPLVALVLHVSGLGLSTSTWALSMTAVSWAAAATGALRISRVADRTEQVAYATSGPESRTSSAEKVLDGQGTESDARYSRKSVACFMAVALALVAASVSVAVVSERNQVVAASTELSALPAKAGTKLLLNVEVTSNETAKSGYVLKIRGAKGFKEEFTLNLMSGETWRRDVTLPVAQRIDVELYLDGATTPYRHVFISGDAW